MLPNATTYYAPLPIARVAALKLPARPTDETGLKRWLGALLGAAYPDQAQRLPLTRWVPSTDATYPGGDLRWWTPYGEVWANRLVTAHNTILDRTHGMALAVIAHAAAAASTVTVHDTPAVEPEAQLWQLDQPIPVTDGRGNPLLVPELHAAEADLDDTRALIRWNALQLAGPADPDTERQAAKAHSRAVEAAYPAALTTAQRMHAVLVLAQLVGALPEEPPAEKPIKTTWRIK